MYVNLAWKYVPYIEELRAWVLENWEPEPPPEWPVIRGWDAADDPNEDKKDNWSRFYEEADRLVESGTNPKHPIQWVLEKTKEHLEGSDPDRIEDTQEDLWATSRYYPRDAYRYGLVLLKREKYSEAEESFRIAVDLVPEDARLWSWLGKAQYYQEKYSEAEESFRRAVELDPEDAERWSWLGQTQYCEQKYSEAEDCYLRATAIDPDEHEHWSWLGRVQNCQEKYSEAEESFSRAVDLYSEDADYWSWLGESQRMQGRHVEAEESLRRAAELNSEDEV